ncbi:MAG: methyltransferase domain-containing protein [Magnetococcales bacterium]|nr:methyltransferase domain-containing protein [Magnetococcales bacterium]
MTVRRDVAAAFGAVAQQYESHALAQAHAARQLRQRIVALHLPGTARILEIGCGSGLMSRHLLELFPAGRLCLTDLSEAMVRVARQRLTPLHPDIHWVVMDGERPGVRGGFDLIVANLTWQWFMDPLGSFARMRAWLRPGGWLVLSTLGEESFPEWRELCRKAGLGHGMPEYPSRRAWETLAPELLEEERFAMEHGSALEFLQSLRKIGAQRPIPGHRPLSPGALRRVLRQQEHPFVATHHLIYIATTPHGHP